MRSSSLMVVLYVHDMQRAVTFYRDTLGLEAISESSGWSMLSCGDAIVGLHIIEPGVTEVLAPHAGLNLKVDDLESAIADIRESGGRLRAIREAEPPRVPVRLAELQDPEGNVFELRQYWSGMKSPLHCVDFKVEVCWNLAPYNPRGKTS